MAQVDPYKVAPTFLFNSNGQSKRFDTQAEVDRAWQDGWFGPPWLHKSAPLLSKAEWTKLQLVELVKQDKRYKGFTFNVKKDTVEDITIALVEWEVKHDLKD